MMNNYEKIKNFSIDEMAILISKGCAYCDFNCHNCLCEDDICLKYIKQWLQAESEE